LIHHRAVQRPSTSTVWPVMSEAAREARQAQFGVKLIF